MLATEETLYAVLGVARNASSDEIRAGYRAAAALYHPDSNSSDPARFERVKAAYATLRDPTAKQSYDNELGLEAFVDDGVAFVRAAPA